jgi:hypothetical protein
MERKRLPMMAIICLAAGCNNSNAASKPSSPPAAGQTGTSIGAMSTAGTLSTTPSAGTGVSSGVAGTGSLATAGTAVQAAGSGAAVVMAAGGGAAGTAGAAGAVDAAGSGGGAAPTPGEPKIPMAPEPCPMLKTGNVTIMGTSVQLFVGTKQADKKGSILIYWHATGSNSTEVAGGIGFTQAQIKEITDEGGIVASGNQSTGKGMNTGNGVWYTEDFKIADEVVACAVQQLNIDTHRIFTAGGSAGALQAGIMVFQRSSYLASSLPNSGGYTIGGSKFEDPNHIPPVMTMHGAPGADVVIVDFSKQSAVLDHLVTAAGGFAIDCNHGGGHVAAPLDLKAVGFQFLKDHPFGVSPEPYATLPSTFPKYCKIWTKDDPIPSGAVGGM